MRVLFFGDSITWGGYDTQGGWVDRLKRQYEQTYADGSQPKHQLYNLGIGGETSDGLLKRIESEIVARELPNSQPAIFVAIGLNDACYMTAKGESEVTPERYVQNLTAIAAICKQYAGASVFFIGLTPIRDSELEFRGQILRQDDVTNYNNVMHDIADKESLVWVEVLEKLKNSKDIWIHDGIHPNDAGHEQILHQVEPIVAKLLIR